MNFDKLNINLGQTYAKRCIIPKIFLQIGPHNYVQTYRSSPWVYADSSERSTPHSSDSTAGQLVTTRCFSRQSTHHTILGCDELTVWRVDWQPVDYRGPLTGSYTVLLTVGDMYATDDLGLILLLWRHNL